MEKFARLGARVVNAIHIAFVWLAMALLVAMTLVISVNVFMRYVLNSGLTWGEEVAKLAVVWFTFIAMAVGVKQGLHISIHILPKNLPPWLDKGLVVLKDLLILFLGLMLLIFGWRLVSFLGSSIMPATGWPSYMLYLILPFSGILIVLEALLDLLHWDDDSEKVETLFNTGAHHG